MGVVGFCFGGTYAFALAAADPRLRAAVPFYGNFPENADPATIGCPVLAFYGEDDHGITDGVPELESRMEQAGVDFTARVYHGVGHAFFNDTSPSKYNAEVGGRRVGADARLLRRAPDAVNADAVRSTTAARSSSARCCATSARPMRRCGSRRPRPGS